MRSRTLTGTLQLTADMGRMHFLDPSGASRDVLLPAPTARVAGLVLFVGNTASGDHSLAVKHGVSTVVTIQQGGAAVLFCDGVEWRVSVPGAGAVTAAMLAAGAVEEGKLAAAAVATAKLAGGAVTGAKLAATGVKSGSFAGRNGAGACALAGAAVGDRVLAVMRIDDAAGAVGQAASFQVTITVVDEIQQTAVGDLSAQKFSVILLPAAA